MIISCSIITLFYSSTNKHRILKKPGKTHIKLNEQYLSENSVFSKSCIRLAQKGVKRWRCDVGYCLLWVPRVLEEVRDVLLVHQCVCVWSNDCELVLDVWLALHRLHRHNDAVISSLILRRKLWGALLRSSYLDALLLLQTNSVMSDFVRSGFRYAWQSEVVQFVLFVLCLITILTHRMFSSSSYTGSRRRVYMSKTAWPAVSVRTLSL